MRNSKDTLYDCLNAIKQSTFNNYEIIVVDDHSKDQSKEIAKKFKCKIVGLRNKTGAAAARNKGANKAVSDILLFIDSDVIIGKHDLNNAYSEFIDNDICAAFATYLKDTPHKNFLSKFYNNYMRFIYCGIHKTKTFLTSFAMIRRDCFTGFDSGLKNATIEDAAFGQELAKNSIQSKVFETVKITHKKRINLKILTSSFFNKSRDTARLCLALLKNRRRYKDESVRVNHLINMLLIPLYIFALFIFGAKIIFFILLAFFISNINFFGYSMKEVGLTFSVLSFIIYIYVSLVIELGVVYGIAFYFSVPFRGEK